MDCPLCHKAAIATKIKIPPLHTIHRCTECSLEFLNPKLSEKDIQLLYSKDYYQAWWKEKEEDSHHVMKMKKLSFKKFFKQVQDLKSTGNVLDIGCATGFFLEVVRDLGYNPYGIEISDYSSKLAKSKIGEERIFHGDLESCSFEKGFFDIICMFDLLEHLSDPGNFMKKVNTLLEEDGLLLILTPDTGSFSNKIMGTAWTHYKREHQIYFNRKSLAELCKQSGFEIASFERAKKALNIQYINQQFKAYPHFLLSPITNLIWNILPSNFQKKNFYISLGEMLVVLKKA